MRPPKQLIVASRRRFLTCTAALLTALGLGCGGDFSGLKIFSPLIDYHHPRVVLTKSDAFLQNRPVWVYLPPGYSTSTARYPVLYMLDGEVMFGNGPKSWRLDRTADSLIAAGAMPPIIIVAIKSADTQRLFEYAPWPDSSYGQLTSGGVAFQNAVASILVPLINGAFRTSVGPHNTYIGGSSIAGVAAVYAGYFHNDTFGRVLAFSPSYWWDDARLLYAAAATKRGNLERIYQDTGWPFDNPPINLYQLRDIALAQGMHDSTDILTVVDTTGFHDFRSWARRAPQALAFIAKQ